MIKELENVVLEVDLPEHDLVQGDLGTVLMVHDGGRGFDVEFMTLDGETVAVVTLTRFQLRAMGQREIAHVREMASSSDRAS